MKHFLRSRPLLTLTSLWLMAWVLSVGCGPESPRAASGPRSAPVVPLTNMVRISAGTFQRIQFPVTLTRDFWIGKYEVTQGEFQGVMGVNPSHFAGMSNHPVEKVSFVAASNYCVRVTSREREQGRLPAEFEYRLPTEAEWEYACRAGSTNRFYFGPTPEGGDAHAWTAENCEATTHPVGLKKPNAWGLHDMHGNVWEWCADWFEPYPPRPLTDPTGPATHGTNKYKVFKGGGWNQDLQYGGASSRFMMSPSNGIHFVGFRIVLSPR
jgi:formylglycine-generating enzyme required for sulfatase activity